MHRIMLPYTSKYHRVLIKCLVNSRVPKNIVTPTCIITLNLNKLCRCLGLAVTKRYLVMTNTR